MEAVASLYHQFASSILGELIFSQFTLILLGMIFIAPLVILVSLKTARKPPVENLSQKQLEQMGLAEFFQQTRQALRPLGFSPSFNGPIETQVVINNPVWMEFYQNEAFQDYAAAIVIRDASGKIKAKYLEFVGRYLDGFSVLTNNSKLIQGFVNMPQRNIQHFPTIKKPELLYALHQERCAQYLTHRSRLWQTYDHPSVLLQDSTETEMDQQVQLGYFRGAENGAFYQPTFKGAFLMTWKQVSPLTWLAHGWAFLSGEWIKLRR